MASFNLYADEVGTSSVTFSGSFTGGQTDYANYRVVRLKINNTTYEYDSTNKGGGDSYFSFTIYGLSPGKRYSWSATLCYYNGSAVIASSYSKTGTVTTEVDTSFSTSVTEIKSTSASFSAEFLNGDAGYGNYRYVKLTINGETEYFRSTTAGGSDSYFNFTKTGLPANTYLSWTAVLCYIASGKYVETSYSYSGQLKTDKNKGYEIYIGDGYNWRHHIAYIGNGRGWDPYDARIGDGNNWQPL